MCLCVQDASMCLQFPANDCVAFKNILSASIFDRLLILRLITFILFYSAKISWFLYCQYQFIVVIFFTQILQSNKKFYCDIVFEMRRRLFYVEQDEQKEGAKLAESANGSNKKKGANSTSSKYLSNGECLSNSECPCNGECLSNSECPCNGECPSNERLISAYKEIVFHIVFPCYFFP